MMCIPAMASQMNPSYNNSLSFVRTTSRIGYTASDSIFYTDALSVVFPVNKYHINVHDYPQLQHFLTYAKVIIGTDNGTKPYIRIRSAASPEGPYLYNCRLAENRAKSLKQLFIENGINNDRIEVELIDEDYELLSFNMHKNNDPLYNTVDSICQEYSGNTKAIKDALCAENNGKLWKYILHKYFPELRASRFMLIIPEIRIDSTLLEKSLFSQDTLSSPQITPSQLASGYDTSYFDTELESSPRRELLSIKTNLLQDFAYVPDYGFCPLWNLAIEYYPLHGHYTYGASLDFPWWQRESAKHKYMQIRNYQLEIRRYFKDDGVFRGFYAQGYANCGLFSICFNAKKGWMGEGFGGGIGCGYVLPISKNQHWRIDLQAQAGVLLSKYDPFVYGDPVDDVEDGLYYYDYIGDADFFKKRQHRFTWFGPTRIGITITYDILYRKKR